MVRFLCRCAVSFRAASRLPTTQHAIDIDATFVDAFTARGAALVLLERFDDAIGSLEHALRLSADDANAARYLDIARQKKRAAAAEAAGTTAAASSSSSSVLAVASAASSSASRVAQAVALTESLNKEKLAGMVASHFTFVPLIRDSHYPSAAFELMFPKQPCSRMSKRGRIVSEGGAKNASAKKSESARKRSAGKRRSKSPRPRHRHRPPRKATGAEAAVDRAAAVGRTARVVATRAARAAIRRDRRPRRRRPLRLMTTRDSALEACGVVIYNTVASSCDMIGRRVLTFHQVPAGVS
jgi:hypothetical protein